MSKEARGTVGPIMSLVLLVMPGCAPSGGDLRAVIQKYAAPPHEIPWNLVDDTEQFWADVDVLYRASLKGHSESLRTLLVLGTFTDGVVAEEMPDLWELVQGQRETAREIIIGNDRLQQRYCHWLEQADY